jgi:hypothetical protein
LFVVIIILLFVSLFKLGDGIADNVGREPKEDELDEMETKAQGDYGIIIGCYSSLSL